MSTCWVPPKFLQKVMRPFKTFKSGSEPPEAGSTLSRHRSQPIPSAPLPARTQPREPPNSQPSGRSVHQAHKANKEQQPASPEPGVPIAAIPAASAGPRVRREASVAAARPGRARFRRGGAEVAPRHFRPPSSCHLASPRVRAFSQPVRRDPLSAHPSAPRGPICAPTRYRKQRKVCRTPALGRGRERGAGVPGEQARRASERAWRGEARRGAASDATDGRPGSG